MTYYPKYEAKTNYTLKYNEYAILLVEINNYAGSMLNNTEFRVLLAYLSRTVRFHKDNEYVPIRHLEDGVIEHGSNECVGGPVPSTKKTIQKTIKSLSEKGLITIDKYKKYPYTMQIIVNITNIREMIKVSKLNISKKLKGKNGNYVSQEGGKRTPTSGGKVTPTEGGKRTPTNNVNNNNGKYNNEKEQSASGEADIYDIVDSVKTKHRTKRKEVLSTPTKFSKKELRITWDALCGEYTKEYDEHPSRISMRTLGMMYHASEKEPMYKSPKWKEYLTDIVMNWDQYVEHLIRDRKYNSANIPVLPDASYFLRHDKKAFLPYYYERTSGAAKRNKMRDTDNTSAMKAKIAKLEERIEKLQSNAKTTTRNDIRVKELHNKLRKAKADTGYRNSLFD